MTDQHTPETDAKLASDLARTLIHTVVCQRDAARAERDAARADIARLRDVLQRIVRNGGSATNVMLFDARTALNTPAQ